MGKVDIYICSKPLQYLNICNIPMSETYCKVLIICDTFYKAKEFSDNIRIYERQWDKVVLSKSRSWVFTVLRYRVNSLFFGVDSTIVGLLRFVKRFKFYLYEEGAGTYNQLKIQDKYRFLTGILGTGEIMGRSKYLNGVYVYFPNYYISQIQPSCPVLSFMFSNRDIIKQKVDDYLRFYGFDADKEAFLNIKHSNILLYITDWEFQTSTIDEMVKQKENYDFLFIKPHPHIKGESIPVIKGIEILYTNIVVEMIIQVWLNGSNKVTVYHQDSTAIIPFGKDINAINVNQSSNDGYHHIIEDLASLSMMIKE